MKLTDGGSENGPTGDHQDAGPGKGYQELVTWQKAMDLVDTVYLETRGWLREELYGLTAQVRKAAVAIPSNLAEGHGRSGSREFAHHASIAYGSLCEVETQLLIAARQGYSSLDAMERLMPLVTDVRRLCRGLLRSLNDRAKPQTTVSPSPSPPTSPPLPSSLPERSDTP